MIAEIVSSRVLERYGKLVAFSHTIFALPFALAMVVVAAGIVTVTVPQFLFILGALISGRTAAMAFNRAIDARIDALNPRTAQREIPSGQVPLYGAWMLFASSLVIFLFTAYALGLHCLVLAPPVLGILIGYSWTKRFTWMSHFVLGLSLALAPGGVWWALVGTVAVEPLLLMAAVLFWVAGFDILYSCQDVDFDQRMGLHSFPARWGIARAFVAARVSHAISLLFFGGFGVVLGASLAYWLGLLGFALCVASQYRVISPRDLSRINIAFFTRNGAASVVFFIGVVLEVVSHGGL